MVECDSVIWVREERECIEKGGIVGSHNVVQNFRLIQNYLIFYLYESKLTSYIPIKYKNIIYLYYFIVY